MNFWCPLVNVPCLEDITFFGKPRSGTPTFSWLLHYCKTWSEILWYMSPEERNTEHPSFYQLWIIESSCTVSALCRRRKTAWGAYVSCSGSPEFQLLRSLSSTVFSGCSPPPASSSLLLVSMTKPAPRQRHKSLPQTLRLGVKSLFLLVWLCVWLRASVPALKTEFPDLLTPICWLPIKVT